MSLLLLIVKNLRNASRMFLAVQIEGRGVNLVLCSCALREDILSHSVEGGGHGSFTIVDFHVSRRILPLGLVSWP